MENEQNVELVEEQQTQAEEIVDSAEVPLESEAAENPKPKRSKKIVLIIAAAAVAIAAILAIILTLPKFERVRQECVQIAGRVTGSGDYFIIDTYPEEDVRALDSTVVAWLAPTWQKNALKAIQYANEELGFNGSVYTQMMNTTALIGRQSAETDKYRVSWTYHPDDGLEVTYEKK